MEKLAYFDNYFVIFENDKMYLQKNVGQPPLSSCYGDSQKEQQSFSEHKRYYTEHFRQAEIEKRELPREMHNEILMKRFPCSPETLAVATKNGITGIMGYLTKEQHFEIFGSRN